jgi:Uma2 family endonuclease
MSVDQRLSVEEFSKREWPRGAQLLDGMVVYNEPTPHHQLLARRIERALSDWHEAQRDQGEVWPSLTLAMGDDRPAPDVMWFSAPLADEYASETAEVPDLVVEVRSPSTWTHDRTHKRALYERRGVREVWLVDDVSETVLRLARSALDAARFDIEQTLAVGQALSPPLLGGFELPLAGLFAPRR